MEFNYKIILLSAVIPLY